jgi:arginyl-tRNA synthetase
VSSLYEQVFAATAAAFGSVQEGADPVVRVSDRADYQANGAMAIAKTLGRNPRDLAEEVAGMLRGNPLFAKVEVAGPGFINLDLSASAAIAGLEAMAQSHTLGIDRAPKPKTVVIDYSSPNVAKEMHVGHLRSTVIGDSLCRLFELTGNHVVRRNHIGDWGTPFGMLIEHLLDLGEESAVSELGMGDLDGFYRQARTKFDADGHFRERSRQRVVALQGGDEETLRLWRVLVAESIRYFDTVYQALNVGLQEGDVRGESFYNDQLDAVVRDLDAKGLIVVSDGASCVFPPGFTNRDGEPLPLIVRKSDEGYGYAATDLAAIRDRIDDVGADLMLYVVGAPQEQHFAMIFAVATMAGWLTESVEAVHVSFGNVLGPDRKMFKTRSGETVKLKALLDEGIERSRAALIERGERLDIDLIASQVAMGAIKYADLSTDRQRDYIFDWDRMLAFEGNTGPYLQYAHARIRSIFRRIEDGSAPGPISLTEPQERALAMQLLALPGVIQSAIETYSPSKLCTYLFDLAQSFTAFYEACPVLKAQDQALRSSRLSLCELTASTLRVGLSALGIDAPEQM